MTDQPPTSRLDAEPGPGYVARVLVTGALVALGFALWTIREAVLLAFAGAIVATLLDALATPVRRLTGLGRTLSVTLATLAILATLAGTAMLIGADVRAQVGDLVRQLPEAARSVEDRFGGWLPSFGGGADEGDAASGIAGGLVGQLAAWSTTVLGAITNVLLVVVAGVFLAVDPATYRAGVVKLFPKGRHALVATTFDLCGEALRRWLVAQTIAMALVGALVWAGALWIGLPAPLGLALFAAATEFVPIVGPILGALPALLLALTMGSETFLWTAGLYLAVQQLESNLITPLVERRMVEIPPALFLFTVVAFGILFGPIGVVVAAPLTIVVFVAVNHLYVDAVLGEDPKG